MSKWADYAIFEVHFNAKHTHIDRLKMFPDLGDKFGGAVEKTRQDVIKLIAQGETFITTYRKDDKWQPGRPVQVVRIGDEYFLKTKPDNTREDNLDDLPEY